MSSQQLQRFQIYDFPIGPYPARVRIALIEKGLESLVSSYTMIDLTKGDHKSPEFHNKLNYSGTVPVLKFEDGTLLTECTAITEYLDSLVGEPLLTGTTPLEKGLIQMFTKRAENEFLEPISLYFHNATSGLGPDVETYQNKEWGLHQREKGFRGLHYFDELLRTRKYIVCDRFTMADLAVIGLILFLDFVNEKIPEECDALLEWYSRMQQRPSFKNRVLISENSEKL